MASALTRFEVLREVGRGAAGIVFQAQDAALGTPVALKIIDLPDAEPGERERFLAEGEILSSLSHPNIVRIVDFGMVEDALSIGGHRFEPATPYLAMEWLDGRDLASAQAERPLELRQALECARQVAGALGAAHAAGIVHRDVKPSNIFVVASGELRVKLVDFGVACADALAGGATAGTPAYMAPEQARGEPAIDSRCDVYSLGATLFELCSGRPPHLGPSPIATLARLVSTPAPRLSELMGEVPDELDDLLAEMLALECQNRPDTGEVERRIERLCADPALELIKADLRLENEAVHSSTSRLVTALVALNAGRGAERDEQIARMKELGAEAVRMGKDAVVAYLGARQARGGEARKAIEIGRQLGTAGASVGVATGRALVDLARPIGEVVDKASSLAREAKSGQLLADDVTAELARGAFDFTRSAQKSLLVGQPVPERRQQVEQTPFVGRGSELEGLLAAFGRCLGERRPMVVSVSGPPGIGKSRLGRELLRRLDARLSDLAPTTAPSRGVDQLIGSPHARVRVIGARCEAYGRARALGCAADALTDLLRLPKGCKMAEVKAALGPLDLVHDEGELLASLLAGEPFGADVQPHRARDVLFLAMTELTLKVIGSEPAALAIEDVQWADPESVAWFDHLASRAAGRPLFILVLARPSFWKDHPQAFRGRDHQRIDLRPIGRRATMEIARAVLGCGEGDPKTEQIARQAAGSPLFAEELARVLAAGRSPSSAPTIEAAIQVSLDGIEPAAREAVTRMSVFGLASWDHGLEHVGLADAAAVCKRLCEAELVVQQPFSRFPGAREFWFKHALVRDVAYASASEALREELHARAAAWLAKTGEDAATVAEHYDLGGQHGEAAGYWEQAALRALAANALPDARRMADRALSFAEDKQTGFRRAQLLDEVFSRLDERSAERADAIDAMADNADDEQSEVRTMGARARYDHARSAGGDIEERLLEVKSRAERLGLLDEEARAAATLATRYAFAGELRQAESEAAHLLALASDRGVTAAAIDAWQTLAVVHQTRGELADALQARRNAAKAASAAGLKNREAMLTINVGFALTTIGAKEEARRELEDGVFMAEEVGSAGTVRLGRMLLLGWAAHFSDYGGDGAVDPSLDAELAEPRASADEAATGGWVGKDRVTLGVLFYRGCELLGGGLDSLRRARALLSLSAEAYRATDNRDVLPVALGYWAEAERRLGEHEQAARIAREAADLVETGAPSLLNEAIIYLALQGARIDLGDFSGARQAIERALPALLRRLRGLRGTPYEQAFLRLPHNAKLIEAVDAQGCMPAELEALVG